MSLLKSIAVPAAVVGAVCGVLAATAPAESSEYREGTINGYQSYILDSGSYSKPDYMIVYGPRGEETISVTCSPFYWEATGPNTKSWVREIAKSWCF